MALREIADHPLTRAEHRTISQTTSDNTVDMD